jgi:hypothetical protein
MKNPARVWTCVIMSLLIIGVNALGLYLHKTQSNENGYVEIAILITAVGTFFGSLLLFQPEDNTWSPSSTILRKAIATSVIMVYFNLAVITIFMTGEAGPTLKVADSFVASFTTIVGVVIAFYFGASAIVQKNGGEE